MTLRITKRPAAGRDIEDVFVHIAQDNLDIGVTFLVAVEDSGEASRIAFCKGFPSRVLRNI